MIRSARTIATALAVRNLRTARAIVNTRCVDGDAACQLRDLVPASKDSRGLRLRWQRGLTVRVGAIRRALDECHDQSERAPPSPMTSTIHVEPVIDSATRSADAAFTMTAAETTTGADWSTVPLQPLDRRRLPGGGTPRRRRS